MGVIQDKILIAADRHIQYSDTSRLLTGIVDSTGELLFQQIHLADPGLYFSGMAISPAQKVALIGTMSSSRSDCQLGIPSTCPRPHVFVYNEDARLQWHRRFELLDPEYSELFVHDVTATDSGLVLIGTRRDKEEGKRIWLTEVDYQGQVTSSICIGSQEAILAGRSVVASMDGGYFIAGEVALGRNTVDEPGMEENAFVVGRVESPRDLAWLHTYGNLLKGAVSDISIDLETQDVFMAGTFESEEYHSFASTLLRLDSQGSVIQGIKLQSDRIEESLLLHSISGSHEGIVLGGSDFGPLSDEFGQKPAGFIMKLDNALEMQGGCPYLEPSTLERRTLDATVVDCPVTLVETTLEASDEVIELVPDNDTRFEKVCPEP
jgi:hypothetical protein